MQTLRYDEWLKQPSVAFPKACTNAGMTTTGAFENIISELPPCSRQGPWIVGGTIRRILINQRPTTDVDIMFKNMKQYEDYCSWLREHGAKTIDESDRQTTFKYKGWEIQPIKAAFSNTLRQTLDKFDFTICQFGFDGENLIWGDHSMEHLNEKKLVFTRTTDHISTMRRAFKYANQGFFMDHDSIGKFLKDATKQEKLVNEGITKWEAEASGYASGGFRNARRAGATPSSYSV